MEPLKIWKDNGNVYAEDTISRVDLVTQDQLAVITAMFRPKIVEQPVDSDGVVGQELTLTCNAVTLINTELQVLYQWQRSFNSGTTWQNVPGADAFELTFNPLLTEHLAQYRCIVTNFFGTRTSNIVDLTVDNEISTLFSPTDRGLAWDLDRMDHLFQTAGGAPVTAYGEPVGQIITVERGGIVSSGADIKSTGVIGLVGTATAATYDTVTGVASVTRVDIVNQSFVTIAVNNTRQYRLEINNTGTNPVWIRDNGAGAGVIGQVAAGANVVVVLNPATANLFFTSQNGTAAFTISSIRDFAKSVNLVQTTSNSRPTYARRPKSGIRNLLQRTEELDNAYWTKLNMTVDPNTAETTDPLGGNTADKITGAVGARRITRAFTGLTAGANYTFSFYVKQGDATNAILFISNQLETVFSSGTFEFATDTFTGTLSNYITGRSWADAGNGWRRIIINVTIPAGQTTLSINVGYTGQDVFNYVWGAQLETGTTVTPYQRVTSQFDVVETGQPSINYLWCDGIDDCMQSATTIDFSNSDEMTVCLAARKQTGILLELGSGASPGSFSLFTGATTWTLRSRGTSVSDNAIGTFPSPSLSVIIGQSKISTDLNSIKVNATTGSQATDQGTGNYSNSVLNIGSRNQASDFFQGHLNSGFIINRLLDLPVLTDHERNFVAASAGIDL